MANELYSYVEPIFFVILSKKRRKVSILFGDFGASHEHKIKDKFKIVGPITAKDCLETFLMPL